MTADEILASERIQMEKRLSKILDAVKRSGQDFALCRICGELMVCRAGQNVCDLCVEVKR